MTTPSGHTILIAPVGNFDQSLTDAIAAEFRRVFGFKTISKPFSGDLDFAFDPGRDQYHSTAILEKLAAAFPEERADKIFALTHVDLFIPILTYVYGEAQLGGKACIISTYRLKEGLSPLNVEKRYIDRIAKEAIHELGHTFRLRHCKDPTCIMHYCRCIADVDHKSDQLCRYCSVLLQDEIERMSG